MRLRGKRLDNFSDLGAVEGLCNGDTVELVEGEDVRSEGVGGICHRLFSRTVGCKERSC